MIMAILFAVSSCEKLEMPSHSNTNESADAKKITILTRSNTNDIKYPILVYAFDANGQCAGQQSINSSSESLGLSLTKGSYRIVALSNTSGYNIPSNPTLSSFISVANANNYSESPLQMGQADVTVGSTNQTVNLILSYKVATVNFTLSDIPSSVTSVSVNIAQQYSAMNLNGDYQSAKNTTVELTKSGSSWTTGDVYMFVGANAATIFSISLTDNNATTSYGYTYTSPLVAATPYNIIGKYSSDMISLSGMFQTEGWGSPIALNFSFGPGGNGNDTPDNGDQGGSGADIVGSYPKAGTIWNGHLVAYVYSTDGTGALLGVEEAEQQNSVNLLLLSLGEWSHVGSATNKDNPDEAMKIASQYQEGDMGGWEIPSKFEAKYLNSLYNEGTLDALNDIITSNGGTAISPLDAKGENNRYLCEDATYTYAWKPSSSITKAGATVYYSLRLVKHVRLSKE